MNRRVRSSYLYSLEVCFLHIPHIRGLGSRVALLVGAGPSVSSVEWDIFRSKGISLGCTWELQSHLFFLSDSNMLADFLYITTVSFVH